MAGRDANCKVLATLLLLCAVIMLQWDQRQHTLRPTGQAGRPSGQRLDASAASLGSSSGGPASVNLRDGAWRGCRVPAGRKLAIYQPRSYHSEVFGVLLAYAKACGHSMPVFYDMQYDALSALPYYDWLFGPVEKRNKDDFVGASSGLDAVFFTTPEIPTSNGEDWHKANAHRFIYFTHLLSHPSYNKEYMVLRLHMTPLVAGPPFALPVYPPPEVFGSTPGVAVAPGMDRPRVAQGQAAAKVQDGQPPGLPLSNARLLSEKRLVMIGEYSCPPPFAFTLLTETDMHAPCFSPCRHDVGW